MRRVLPAVPAAIGRDEQRRNGEKNVNRRLPSATDPGDPGTELAADTPPERKMVLGQLRWLSIDNACWSRSP
jgi:hypothetical protein